MEARRARPEEKDAQEQSVAVEETAMSDDEDGAAHGSAPGFVPTLLTLAYTEESVTQNRRRHKFQSGLARVNQTEWVHIVSDSRICLPSRKRLHFAGSTVGDIITGVEVPAVATEWHMPWGSKKEYYGKKMLVAVGGKTEVAAEDKQAVAKTSSTMVPVAYHLMPDKYYDEMIHTFFAKCVIDLTPESGKFGWCCLKNKTGYVAITTGEPMSIALRGHWVDLLKEEMSIPGSKVYNAGYALDAKHEPEKPETKKGKKDKQTKKKPEKPEKPEKKPTKPTKRKGEDKIGGGKKSKKKPRTDANGDSDDGAASGDEGSESDSNVWDPLVEDSEADA